MGVAGILVFRAGRSVLLRARFGTLEAFVRQSSAANPAALGDVGRVLDGRARRLFSRLASGWR